MYSTGRERERERTNKRDIWLSFTHYTTASIAEWGGETKKKNGLGGPPASELTLTR